MVLGVTYTYDTLAGLGSEQWFHWVVSPGSDYHIDYTDVVLTDAQGVVWDDVLGACTLTDGATLTLGCNDRPPAAGIRLVMRVANLTGGVHSYTIRVALGAC